MDRKRHIAPPKNFEFLEWNLEIIIRDASLPSPPTARITTERPTSPDSTMSTAAPQDRTEQGTLNGRLRNWPSVRSLTIKFTSTIPESTWYNFPPRSPAMYLRLAFWTASMTYISSLLSHLSLSSGHSSPGDILTAGFLGALLGLVLWYIFANRVKRKYRSSPSYSSR